MLETIFDRLLKLRNDKKLSKKDMADILGCTPTSYGRYETGERELGIKSLIPIYHMGCNLNWLITGRGEMERDETDPSQQLFDKEFIELLIRSHEKYAASLENLSVAAASATKTAENLSQVLAKQQNKAHVSNNYGNIG